MERGVLVVRAPSHGSFDRVALLLDRRRSALLYAKNHFNPLSRHPKRERLLAHLAARLDKPRFRVYAWSRVVDEDRVCLAGWSTQSGDALALSEALLALRLRDGSEVLAEGQVSLLGLPADGVLGAVWALVKADGIVVELDVPGDGPVDDGEWRECWRHRVMDPVSDHKRVPVTGDQALPHAPPTVCSLLIRIQFAGWPSCRPQSERTAWRKPSIGIAKPWPGRADTWCA